jgi:branched-chain amino acid transport system permease protein
MSSASIPTQLLLNGLVAGGVYALVALGFALVYASTRFFHFAHGVVYTAAAYVAFGLSVSAHLPLAISVALAIIAAGLLGAGIEVGVYRPLRRRYASSLILLIASFGVYIVLQNVISMLFGDNVKSLRQGPPQEGLLMWGARVTPLQIGIVIAAVALFVITGLVIMRTRTGKALRAVANDAELALASGIDSERVILFAFAMGSVLAAVAAILVSFDVDMVPTMGMNALLMGVVATIIGGIGSIPGAAVGGLLLGLAQHLGVWKIGSQWQDSIAFLLLLLFLLVRPYGVFGRKLTKARV